MAMALALGMECAHCPGTVRITTSIRRPGTFLSCRTGYQEKCSLRLAVVAAALPQENEDDDFEEDEYGDDEPQQQPQRQVRKGGGRVRNAVEKMKRFVEKVKDPRKEPREQARARLLTILERMDKLYEDEEPSEGIKQLVEMMEKAKASMVPEPPPRFQVPQLVADLLTYIAIYAVVFAVAHVTAVRDEKRFAKMREEAELRRRTEPERPPPPPTIVDKAVAKVALVIEEWQLRVAYLVRQRMEVIIAKIEPIILMLKMKLGWGEK